MNPSAPFPALVAVSIPAIAADAPGYDVRQLEFPSPGR